MGQREVFSPEYNVRIDWTYDPARTTALVQRVFEEIEFVRRTPLSAGQADAIHETLMREFERNSDDKGYLLGQISRTCENGEARDCRCGIQPAGPDPCADG